eukprot:s2990_g17.t1
MVKPMKADLLSSVLQSLKRWMKLQDTRRFFVFWTWESSESRPWTTWRMELSFQLSDRGTSATFAPTSGVGARLILVAHCCLGWLLSFVDIRDAFLLAPQREQILVEKPVWWEDAIDGCSRYWSLNKCLPGQRNAAARFFDFLCEHLESLESENTMLLPSLQKFTLQGGEILPTTDQSPDDPVRFLKKRHFFTEAGVVISPHEKYCEELVQLYGLEGRNPKATPDMALENYESPELDDDGKSTFEIRNGNSPISDISAKTG